MLELRRIGAHRIRRVGECRLDPDGLGHEPPQHRLEVPHHVGKVKGPNREHLLAAERQELLRQHGGPFRGEPDLAEVASDRLVGANLIREQPHVPEDRRQHVVEVVRHTAGQLPHGFHLLGLAQLLVQALLIAGVTAPRLLGAPALLGRPQLPLDGRGQSAHPALDQKIVRAGLHRGDGGLLPGRSGDDNERQVDIGRLQDRQRGQRGAPRKGVVGQDDIPLRLRERRGQRGFSLHTFVRHRPAAALQRTHHQLGIFRRVVHDQHTQRLIHLSYLGLKD